MKLSHDIASKVLIVGAVASWAGIIAQAKQNEITNDIMACRTLSRGELLTHVSYQKISYDFNDNALPKHFSFEVLDAQCGKMYGIKVTRACAAESVRHAIAEGCNSVPKDLIDDARATTEACINLTP